MGGLEQGPQPPLQLRVGKEMEQGNRDPYEELMA